jgi:cytochrome c biogenesis protein CcdA
MPLLIASFLAGMLTVLAPCILPLLPVVVGGAVAREGLEVKNRWRRPLIITASLALSVVIFTLILKATTALLGIPVEVWQAVSGTIVILFGLTLLIPRLWDELAIRLKLQQAATRLNTAAFTKSGTTGDVVMGASLGPIFNSCSPTYAIVVASVLPAAFLEGLAYLLAYAAGLSLMLLLIAYFGQDLVRRLGWLNKPGGWFGKVIGSLFIIVGVAVITGLDKKFQTFVLENGWYDPIYELEQKLML